MEVDIIKKKISKIHGILGSGKLEEHQIKQDGRYKLLWEFV